MTIVLSSMGAMVWVAKSQLYHPLPAPAGMASSSALSVLYPYEGAISTSSKGKSSRMAPPSPGPLTPLFTRIVVPLNARTQLAEAESDSATVFPFQIGRAHV